MDGRAVCRRGLRAISSSAVAGQAVARRRDVLPHIAPAKGSKLHDRHPGGRAPVTCASLTGSMTQLTGKSGAAEGESP